MVENMCLVTYIFGPVLTSLTVCVLKTVVGIFVVPIRPTYVFADNSLQFGRCLVLLRLPFLSYPFAVSFHLAPFPIPPHFYLGYLPLFSCMAACGAPVGSAPFYLRVEQMSFLDTCLDSF